MNTDYKNAYKKNGIRGLVKYIARRVVGTAEYDEKIDTLNYFLNSYADITKFPKATGALRAVQKGDMLLLAIVDAVCKKNSIVYWIDGGTCLGAVRHGGFIPWDDDVDICMMRDDYERAVEILPNELEKYGINAVEERNEPTSRIGVGYRHKETGIWIDIMPCEYTSIEATDQIAEAEYADRAYKYSKKWQKKRHSYSRQQMTVLRKKYIPEICDKENAHSIMYNAEFATHERLLIIDDILPVVPIKFEEFTISGPHNPHQYVKKLYGANYMGFPKSGLAHHGDDRGGLIGWAEATGTDMEEVIEYLKKVFSDLNN